VRPYLKKTIAKRAGEVAQGVGLSSNPSAAKKKKCLFSKGKTGSVRGLIPVGGGRYKYMKGCRRVKMMEILCTHV
jgi:hypothetical protein